jgi:hypothetical protein
VVKATATTVAIRTLFVFFIFFDLVVAAMPPVFVGCGLHRLITCTLEYAATGEIPQRICRRDKTNTKTITAKNVFAEISYSLVIFVNLFNGFSLF